MSGGTVRLGGCALLGAMALAGCDKGGAGDLVFTDDNNYDYTGVVSIEAVEVQPLTDVTLDWSAMTTDLRGRPLDPAAVEQVAIIQCNHTQAEVEDLIATNALTQADCPTSYVYANYGDTTATASSFGIIGNQFDPTDPQLGFAVDDSKTWLASLMNVSDNVSDVLASVFIVPTDGSTNTQVAFTDTSTTLTVTALDIAGKPAIESATGDPTEPGLDKYSLDWSAVTKDVNGADFDPLLGDTLNIAHVAVDDPAQVEDLFLRLDTEADEYFKSQAGAVYGVTKLDDLSSLATDDGTAFSGFTSDGVWLAAVTCSTCTSPVPMLLGIIDVK